MDMFVLLTLVIDRLLLLLVALVLIVVAIRCVIAAVLLTAAVDVVAVSFRDATAAAVAVLCNTVHVLAVAVEVVVPPDTAVVDVYCYDCCILMLLLSSYLLL